MKRFTSLFLSRMSHRENEKPVHPLAALILSIVGVAIGLALTGLGDVIGSEPLILGLYLVGVMAAAIAWFGNIPWKQSLWTVGMLLAAISMAAMFLTGQFWLAAGAFVFLIAIIVYPTVRQQTLEDVRRRRELNRH
jgi:uncharacterized RDD family membrane protein YckC